MIFKGNIVRNNVSCSTGIKKHNYYCTPVQCKSYHKTIHQTQDHHGNHNYGHDCFVIKCTKFKNFTIGTALLNPILQWSNMLKMMKNRGFLFEHCDGVNTNISVPILNLLANWI